MVPLDARTRRLALVLAAMCAVVVLAVAVKVHRVQGPLRLDVRAGHAVSARPLGIPLVPVRLAQPYERLGDTGEFAFLVVVVASWAAWVRDRAGAVLAVVGPAVTLLLTEVVGKPFVARREGTAYGFPSGHTAAIAALSMVGLLVASRRWGRRGLLAAAPPAALAPLIMAVTVVRLRAHLLSDALAGVVLGFGTVLGVAGVMSVALVHRQRSRISTCIAQMD